MKITSKIMLWILTFIFVFVVVNLTIGFIKYKSLNNYIDHLNQKDWSKTISQISISNPKSILNVFYGDLDFSKQTEKILDISNLVDEEEILETGNNEFDPYDPDFQDEFNSFFGGQDSLSDDLNKDVEAGFIIDLDEEMADSQ